MTGAYDKSPAAKAKVPHHIPSIKRPQDEYGFKVDNSYLPFDHVWLDLSEDGTRRIHPLEKLDVEQFIDRSAPESEPVRPADVEDTKFTLVQDLEGLRELVKKLKDVNEFAVDLEHHQFRSYQGLTCLMQISTRTEDFIIDTLKLRVIIGRYLTEHFKDPTKRKIMHGADRDILWLQRDFGLYVCNLFDTGQASRVLDMERNSLEYLLQHYCGVAANKEYQSADWRLRPLPDEMIKYAREDTHYLLYIYDSMRLRLQQESTSESDLLLEVQKRSNAVCLQLYQKELLTDQSCLHIYGLQDHELDATQLAVLSDLYQWRDSIAREQDESTGYVLPNKALIEIANEMPTTAEDLRSILKSRYPVAEKKIDRILNSVWNATQNSEAFEGIAEQLKKVRLEQGTEAVGEELKRLALEVPVDNSTSGMQTDYFRGYSNEQCSNSQIENRMRILEALESELLELKTIFQDVKVDFRSLQSQFRYDITEFGHNIEVLSKAALGYNQALKENRNLYNLLQEVRGNIRVFCRIRPLNSESISSIEHIGNDGSIMVCDPSKAQTTRKIFQFNKTFGPTTTQDEVYMETQSLIRSVMDGYNVCIFAYGQTGSGKTHTMCGPSGGLSSNDLGVNYMALNDLFTISTSREDMKYDIRVRMVEIYNEQVRDLLREDTSSTKLDIRISTNGLFNIPDAKMCPVQSPSDVMKLMLVGEKHRASGPTAMNNRSSRSHSILTVHVNGKDMSGNVSCSCLHLVDLAGSERVDRSEAAGDRLKEAQHINKSLSCLGDVITALAQKNSHIPYRNSKLTQLLQSSLGGNAKTLMLAHISPEGESYVETLSTLKFAQRVSTVELGTAHANKESNDIRELKEQVDTHKKALATKDEKSSLKLKENTVTSERTKKLPERTPPRPRRLSLENASSGKGSIPGRAPKSPISVMKFNRDHMTTHDKECSIDGFNHTKHQRSVIQPVRQETEKLVPTDDVVTFYQLPPDAYNQYKQSGLDTPQRTPCRSRYMGVEVSQMDESSEAKLDKTTTSNVTKKGSHLRRSIQSSIGKLIHGSERRNTPHSTQATPAKISTNTNYDGPSPIATDARLKEKTVFNRSSPAITQIVSRREVGFEFK